jgi:CheY-like chemotaxis protein
MSPSVDGRRILVVEDSPVVLTYIAEVLDELGCTIVGPAQNMAIARTLAADESFDAALVDIRIRGEKSFPICDILAARNIPFILTSGYADWAVPDRWQDSIQVPKPFKLEDLQAALQQVLP